MGGMFTVLKVRDGITSYDDPGWYDAPAGTLAAQASAEELAADGIEILSVEHQMSTEGRTSRGGCACCRSSAACRRVSAGRR